MTWSRGGKRAAICKPRREASGETNPANTLILDFQSPELWENKFLLLKPPGVWYFVMAAWANTDCCRQPTQAGVTVLWPRIWQTEDQMWWTGHYWHSKCTQDHRESHEVPFTHFSPVGGMCNLQAVALKLAANQKHPSHSEVIAWRFQFRNGLGPGKLHF